MLATSCAVPSGAPDGWTTWIIGGWIMCINDEMSIISSIIPMGLG